MPAVPTVPTWAAGQRVYASQLTSLGSVAAFSTANKPIAVLTQATPQLLTNNTAAAITFDASTVDNTSGHSNTVNPSRWTASYPGWYRVRGQVTFAASATNDRSVQIYKNGTAVSTQWNVAPSAGASFAPGRETEGLVFLNGTTDYVEIWALQNSGGALNTFAGTVTSSMQVSFEHS